MSDEAQTEAAAEAVIGLYQRYARAWADRRGKDLAEQAWLDRMIDLAPEASVLDLGCGTGLPVGAYLMRRGMALTGVDASEPMIAMAKQNLPEAEFLVGDMRDLSLQQRFGAVLLWDSAFHLTMADQRDLLPKVCTYCAAGGVLMFSAGPRAGAMIGTFEGEPLYHASLAPLEYDAVLRENGFDVVERCLEDPDCGRRSIWLALRRAG
ncbi:MAG: class I SAM-dependent methyltransferase [Pseudomonadota bacterium]